MGVCLKALGASAEMPSGKGSVHHHVDLVLVKLKALSRFFASRFYNVYLCTASPLSQRGLPPMHCAPMDCAPRHCAPPMRQLSSRLP